MEPVGCLLIVLLFIIVCFAVDLAVMAAWNFALVPLFHFPPVTFWQVVAVLFILQVIGGCFRATVSSKE